MTDALFSQDAPTTLGLATAVGLDEAEAFLLIISQDGAWRRPEVEQTSPSLHLWGLGAGAFT